MLDASFNYIEEVNLNGMHNLEVLNLSNNYIRKFPSMDVSK